LSGVRTSHRFAALSSMGMVDPVFGSLSRRELRRLRRANRMFGSAGLLRHRGAFGHHGLFGHHGPFGHYGVFGHYGPLGAGWLRRRAAYRYGWRRRRFARVPKVLLGLLLLAIVAAVMSWRGETNDSQWW
jgi:hypothetical protein